MRQNRQPATSGKGIRKGGEGRASSPVKPMTSERKTVKVACISESVYCLASKRPETAGRKSMGICMLVLTS